MNLPTDALWNQATALHLQDKFAEAEQCYVRLLEQNHDNAGLLTTLGTLYLQVNRPGLAIHFLEEGVKQRADADAFTNLGLAYKTCGQIDKARHWFEKSIKENPTPESLTNYSGLFIECGEDEKCIDLCRKAIAKKYDMQVAHWNMAIALLANGKWSEAWDEYEWGLKDTGIRERRFIGDYPWWDGSPDKTVLIYGEQGLGDEIMFASMLRDVMRTNKVILECHQRLENLFKKSFPQITVYGTREERRKPSWVSEHKIDAILPIGSLGKFYRRNPEDFHGQPYLNADPVEKGNKFRIGISWTGGGAKQGRVIKRSVPLAWWSPILSVPEVEFVSLQYTDCAEDLKVLRGMGHKIQTMDEYAKAHDYLETANLVASCDLVISVCTSVVHLAGALGVPCWVMTPKFPAWRYQNKGVMPWYRSVRLYRQPAQEADAWIPVVQTITSDLRDHLQSEKRILRIA